MSGKFKLLAVSLLAGTVFVSMAPATVQAAGADKLNECIAARSDESNQEAVRSECMWKHWEWMASWGR